MKHLTQVVALAAPLTLLCLPLQASMASSAENPDYVFCSDRADENCSKLDIISEAAAAIKKTTIKQLSTDGLCEKRSHVIKRNLSQKGKKAVVFFDDRCKYKVRYNTTSGCTGDKDTYVRPGDASSYDGVKIQGGCGTLYVSKYTSGGGGFLSIADPGVSTIGR